MNSKIIETKPQLFCSLDLELEQNHNNPQTPDSKLDHEKIIQVGYCIFEVTETDIKIHRSRSLFVNIGVPLSAFIKKLTGISDAEVASGGSLLEAYQMLCEDLKDLPFKRAVIQWGGGDIEAIRDEMDHEGCDYKWEFGRSGLNVKHMFQIWALANNKKPSGGLSKSLTKIGLDWDTEFGGKHDALSDAVNTAKMFGRLFRSLKGPYAIED